MSKERDIPGRGYDDHGSKLQTKIGTLLPVKIAVVHKIDADTCYNRNVDNTDIVVLSACETGLGDIESGEGVYGLQRAFLTAGVKIVIISLFKVDDTVTKLFMEKMSSKFIETKNSNVALKYAKKEVQKQYPEPIYWGSFIMAN